MQKSDESSVYDHHSMDQTYRNMRLKILNHAHRLIRDIDQAEDICQLSFEAAIRQWRGAEGKRAPFTANQTERDRECWLYRISTNKSMDYLRGIYKITKHSIPLTSDSLITFTSYLPSLEDQVLIRDELRIALAQLPTADVELLMCHYVLGYSLDELAAAGGKQYEAVKKHHYRAKQALAQVLETPLNHSKVKGRNS